MSAGLASSALGAVAKPPYSVNLAYLSNAVSGVAPSAATGVTVNLLRLSQSNQSSDGSGDNTVWNKIGTFSATPASGSWSGSFPAGVNFLPGDQVEVIYAGTIPNAAPTVAPWTPAPSPNQITIGTGNFQQSDQTAFDSSGNMTKAEIFVPSLLNGFVVDFDGKVVHCVGSAQNWCEDTYGHDLAPGGVDANLGFSVSVAGGAAQSTAGNGLTHTQADNLTLATPATAAQSLAITASTAVDGWFNGGDNATEFSTQVNVTVPGPQLSVPQQPLAGAVQTGTTTALPPVDFGHGQTGQASCTAFLVLSEVTCSNLTPGSYTLTDGATTASFTVPAATVFAAQKAGFPSTPDAAPTTELNFDESDYQAMFVPNEGGAAVPGLAAGQTVTLSQSGRTLSTLMVASEKFASARALGDLSNGSNGTMTGSCTPNLEVNGSPFTFCGSGGTIPSPNSLGSPTSESQGNLAGFGGTTVFLPRIDNPFSDPSYTGTILTPFNVVSMARYNDPITGAGGVNDDNTPPPAAGPKPVLPSTSSSDQVLFQYAPLNPATGAVGTFVTLGNINVAGGAVLPTTVTQGFYDGRWTVSDAAGNSSTTEGEFYVQGASQTQLAIPVCSAKVKNGGLHKATIAKAKKKKKPKKPPTLTINCTSSVAGARVAVWVQRGNTVVVDGSGAVKKGKVSISMTSKSIKKGTYQLIEVIDSNGHSNEATHTLTLK